MDLRRGGRPKDAGPPKAGAVPDPQSSALVRGHFLIAVQMSVLCQAHYDSVLGWDGYEHAPFELQCIISTRNN